jgi:hypothetical protein
MIRKIFPGWDELKLSQRIIACSFLVAAIAVPVLGGIDMWLFLTK